MSNPFDDLESGQDDSDDESEIDATSTDGVGKEQTSSTSEDTVVVESEPEPARESREVSTETDPAEAGPAFEYSEVRQKPIYARGESWDEFEKTFRTTIAPTLAESGVVDEETREVHDALLRLANKEPERVAELILEARRQS